MSHSPPRALHAPPANKSSSGCARALFILIAGFALVAVLAWMTKDKPGEVPKKAGDAPVPIQVK